MSAVKSRGIFSPNDIGRWVLTLIFLSVLPAWWVGFQSWGVLVFALLLLWCVLIAEKVVRRDIRLPGNPFNVVLIGWSVVLLGHLAPTFFGETIFLSLNGRVTLSLLMHVAILALGIMLVQENFRGRHAFSGLPVFFGGVLAVWFAILASQNLLIGTAAPVVLSFCGAGILTANLGGYSKISSSRARTALQAVIAFGSMAVGAICNPQAALLSVAVAACVLLLAGISWKRPKLCAVALGIGLPASAMVFFGGSSVVFITGCGSWFGRGEQGFAEITGADPGLAILLATVGWAGVLWLLGGVVTIVVLGLRAIRKRSAAERWRGAFWAISSSLSLLAMLVTEGFFLPGCVLAVAITWGLLPRMLRMRVRYRHGWIAVLISFGFMGVLLFRIGGGVVGWGNVACGLNDKAQHFVFGFFLSFFLGWLFGKRRAWLGVTVIVVSILAGGLAEIVQSVSTSRRAELADWLAHILGGLLAGGLFMLCTVNRKSLPRKKRFRRRQKLSPLRSMAVPAVSIILVLGWGGFLWNVWRQTEISTPDPVLSDGVAVSGARIFLSGNTQYSYAGRLHVLICGGRGEQPVQHPWNRPHYPGGFFPHMLAPEPGLNTLRIFGMPYGPLTGQDWSRKLLIIKPGSTLWVLDARDVLAWRMEQQEVFQEFMGELNAKANVCFWFPGNPLEYDAVRLKLDACYPNIPCLGRVFPGGKTDTYFSLSRLMRSIKVTRSAPVQLVTRSVPLAKVVGERWKRACKIHRVSTETQSSAGNVIPWSNLKSLRDGWKRPAKPRDSNLKSR